MNNLSKKIAQAEIKIIKYKFSNIPSTTLKRIYNKLIKWIKTN